MRRAHPRVSGENFCVCVLVGDVLGSSPRERGKLASRPFRRKSTRLIPA
mgnify:CR=1 FL=1